MSVTFSASTDQEKITFGGQYYDRPVAGGEGPNFANTNAVALLNLLGIFEDDADYMGKMKVDEFQCALAIARAFWDDEAVKFTREEERGENFISFGLDEEGLQRRLNQVAAFVVYAKHLGATHICWA